MSNVVDFPIIRRLVPRQDVADHRAHLADAIRLACRREPIGTVRLMALQILRECELFEAASASGERNETSL